MMEDYIDEQEYLEQIDDTEYYEKQIEELQERIDKVIEYIESRAREAGVKLMPREKELLSILRGEE